MVTGTEATMKMSCNSIMPIHLLLGSRGVMFVAVTIHDLPGVMAGSLA